MVNNFTTVSLPKDLLQKLKEEKKSCQRRSYAELFEYWMRMQKNYLELRKIQELRQISKEDINKAEEFFNKLNQIDGKIETLTEKTSNSFNFILEKFNNHEGRLNILEREKRE